MATQWMQDPAYSGYQADTTSSERMSEEAPESCRFTHNQCDKELFTSEYLRSNKASGHKNLRCFPHCCGGHNPKSFCGSGLVVEYSGGGQAAPANGKTLASPTTVDTSLGRSSLVVGREYPRQELFDDVKMPDQPFGRWFRGSAVPNGSGSGTCFLLNGNRQSWHYGWQSSRLNCKNLHVFKVYVFDASASGNANTLTCVAALASPAFRISSSRKARKTFRSPMNTTPNATTPMGFQNVIPRAPSPSGSTQSARSIDELLAGLQENRTSMPSLPGVGSFLNNSTASRSTGTNRTFHSRRSSLAALPMPVSNPLTMSRQHQRPVPVLTPITGMMQLRLENHSPYTSTPIASSTPSSSSSSTNTTRLTAAALHQHAYASADRMIPEGGGISMMMMSPGSSPDSYLNRKRNRSTDSDKAITAAIEASEKIHPTLSPVSSPPRVAPVPTDSELYRRARILQLAFTIVKRIHRFEEVAAKQKETPKVYRHSFEMITPPMPTTPVAASNQRKKCSLVQIPLSNPKLLYLCSNLVTVCASLVSSGLLEDMRQKMRDCAQAGRGVLAAYQQVVDLLNDSVEAQVSRLPRRMHKSWGDAESADEGEWDLYEMLKSCEPWLMQEAWWVVLDDDDQQQAGDKEEGALRPLPYMHLFADYYRAIQDAVPSPQDLEVAGEPDEHHLQQPQRVASVRSATAASSLSWLARCIHAHTTKTFHITETDTTMTLSLPNSLVSADAVFLLQLDQQEPTVVLPQDYFPFGWSRKRSLMAYRAWRVRGIGDSNGSAVAVQFMRWPDDNELEAVENDEEEKNWTKTMLKTRPKNPKKSRWLKRLRTRITIYFSVFSSTTLQLRTIVEASLAPAAALPAASTTQPTDADMLKYFKSPSSWEMRSQISQKYTKNL
ncbi:hypothetical protein GQ600_19307 [Phytophthora cactorum]|nr:hypothetical protein GQ600_19307 [Phytophthora cactorum]